MAMQGSVASMSSIGGGKSTVSWLVLVCYVRSDTSDWQMTQVPKTGTWGESFTLPQRVPETPTGTNPVPGRRP